MAAAATLVMAMGWDAAPGSPLHTIQLAREDVSLVLASPGHAVALRLDYAEARLRDAVSSSDRRDSLAEAASLLNTVRQELPANHADPLWARWSDDQRFLATLLAGKAAPSSQANRGGAGGRDDGSPVTGSTGDRGGRGSQSGGDGGGASPAGAPASPTGPDRGGDGSGSGRQPSSAPAPADGGGGDGSRGATGGGSSTLSPAPSGGDGGRGGQD